MADEIERQIQSFIERGEEFERKLPEVMARALNQTAFAMMEEGRSRMDTIFEGGVNDWTRQSLVVEKASPDRLIALVGHKPIQAHYLALQEEGGVDDRSRPAGVREPKKLAIPLSGATLDGRGNLPVDFVDRVKGDRKNFFVGKARGTGDRTALFQRVRGINGVKDKIEAVVLFVKERVYRKPKYGFKEWGIAKANDKLPEEMRKAVESSIRKWLRGEWG